MKKIFFNFENLIFIFFNYFFLKKFGIQKKLKKNFFLNNNNINFKMF